MFTRVPDAPRFVPEVIRTPAYPAFLAAVYRVFGVGQLPVALAQTALFVLICMLSYTIARATVPAVTERLAIAAAAATALFPPIPYFGALVMTEVWTTALFTLSMWAVLARTAGTAPSRSRVWDFCSASPRSAAPRSCSSHPHSPASA